MKRTYIFAGSLMLILNTRKLLMLAVPIAVTIAVLLELSGSGHAGSTSTVQDQIRSRKDDKQERDEFPIAVYSASLPHEPAERALRHARNSKYDKRYPVPLDELPADTSS